MPSKRVLMLALMSRSCSAPQPHFHCLTESPSHPLGPVKALHEEQVFVELREATSAYRVPPARLLYANCCRSCACALDATLFPNFLAIPLWLSVLHTKVVAYPP